MKIKNLFLMLAALLLFSVPSFAQRDIVIDQGIIGVIPVDGPVVPIDDPGVYDGPSGYMTPEMIEYYDCVVIGGVVYGPTYDEEAAMVYGYTDGLPANATIKSKINPFGNEINVVGIDEGAFAGCTSLTSVAIPNSVEKIWPYAFAGCVNLEIIIPSSVTNIGNNAFAGVKHVINASFCEDEEEEDWGAVKLDWFTDEPEFECELEGGFECEVWCDYDEAGVYMIGVDITGYHGEGGDITIPYGVTGIDEDAFEHCETITSVKIPESVDFIGSDAFAECESLTSVTIPNSVKYIGDATFYGCTSLSSVTIPNSVTTIGNGVFFGCNSLTSVNIPNGVTTIGNDAFAGCENLESLTIPTSVTSIGEDAFFGVKSIINLSLISDEDNWGALANNAITDEDGFVYEANTEKKKLLAYIGNNSEVTIPDNVKIISEYAFLNHGVETVIIPEDAAVTSIEDWAFAGVTNVINNNSYTDGQPWGAWALNGENGGFSYNNVNGEIILTKYNGEGGDITIPYGVTAIAREAFANCESLTSVKIPETVETIGEGAFAFDQSITSVTIPGSVETIGDYAFQFCENLESVTINEGVETIGEGAFGMCVNLETVTVPSSVTSIGDWAFDGVLIVNNNSSCTDEDNWGAAAVNGIRDGDFIYAANSEKKKLLAYVGDADNVIIPDDVEIIGKYVCYFPAPTVTIPSTASVTYIEDWAFAMVNNVINESSYTEGQPWGAELLNGNDGGFEYEFDNGGHRILTGYHGEGGDITIPYGYTAIAPGAFAECESLTSVKIPETVWYINEGAFAGCESLTSVTIPKGVETIGEGAFAGCYNLKSITVPSSVETIGPLAFDGVKFVINSSSCTEGQPWGAEMVVNGEIDEDGFLYAPNTNKTVLLAYIGDGGVVTIPETVKTIAEGAFAGCESLTSVTIPDGVETIGDYAFCECYNLKLITVPSSVTSIGDWAFGGVKYIINNSSCTDEYNWGALMVANGEIDGEYMYGLNTDKTVLLAYIGEGGDVTIPETVKTIGEGAFADDQSITSVTIPNGVETIGDYAFCDCYNLKLITVPSSVESIGEWAFSGVKYVINNSSCTDENNWGAVAVNGEIDEDGFVYEPNTNQTVLLTYIGSDSEITIPESVIVIGEWAFSDCNSLTSVTIPEGVTVIGEGAFEYCNSLTSVTIPESVKTIDAYAFNYCESLASVNIPSSVETIGDYALAYCKSLVSVTIPESVKTIDAYAFYHCESLVSVTIPESVETIGEYAFEYCNSLASVTIPEGVETIGKWAFGYCSNLESINIPLSVTTIGNNPFSYCSKIESITIPEGVTTIGEYEFAYLTGMKSVTIPHGVTTLCNWAFYGCTSLTTVTIPESVTSIGQQVFSSNGSGGSIKEVYCSANPEALDRIYNLPRDGKITYHVPAEYLESWMFYHTSYVGDDEGRDIWFSNNITFVADVKSINDEDITINIASQTYTGNDLTPVIEVKDGEETLVEGIDYTVALPEGGCANAGNYTVTITGMKRYYKSVEKTFTINPAEVTVTADNKEITFGDSEPTLTATITGLVNNESESLITYTIGRVEGEDVGEYAITPAGAEVQGNYAVSFEAAKLTINAKALTAEEITISEIAAQTYTGEAIEPAFTVKDGDITLEEDKDYTFEYSDNTNAGQAKIAITFKGNYSGSAEKSFTINPAAVTVTADNKEITFGDSEPTLTATIAGLVNNESESLITYTISRAEGNNAGVYAITPAGDEEQGNYAVSFVEGSLKINKAVPSYTAPTIAEQPCGAKLADIQLGSGFAFAAGSAELASGANKRMVVFTPEDTDNYKVVENIEVTITVSDHVHAEAVAENYKAPTCTVAGSVDSVVYCTVCKEELSRKTVEIKIIPHTAGEAVAENYKAPTCTVAGSVDSVVYCTVCKEELSRKTVEITTIPHTAGEAVAENYKAPTCTEAGSVDSVVYCTVCKEELSRKTVKIDAAGHKADSVAIENVVAATYTAAGSYDSVVYCSVCKKELSRTKVEVPQLVVPKIDTEVVISQIEYTVGDSLKLDGGKIIIATSDSTTAEVVITPEMVKGFNPDSVGVQIVTVEFTVNDVVYTTTFEVEVKAPEVIEIAAKSVVLTAPAKITYKQGEQLDIAGGKLTVTYSDGSTQDVDLKADMISGFDAEKVGTQKLTITLKIDKVTLTATFDVTVEANDNTAISDAEAAAVNIYAFGNTIVVENAEDDIYVYDAMGRLIVETPHCDVSTEIRINRAGVYIVKTGTTAKRVMIND